MRRKTYFEPIAVGLTILTIAACATSIAVGEGEKKTAICHNGNDLIVADPAVYQAHLDHGDCAGTCAECLGRCCWIDADGVGQTALTQPDICEAIFGLFQYDETAPCPKFGD